MQNVITRGNGPSMSLMLASFIHQSSYMSIYNYIGVKELCTHGLQCQVSLWGAILLWWASRLQHSQVKVHSVSVQIHRAKELCPYRLQSDEPHLCTIHTTKVHSVSIRLYRHQWTMHPQIARLIVPRQAKSHCKGLMSPMLHHSYNKSSFCQHTTI